MTIAVTPSPQPSPRGRGSQSTSPRIARGGPGRPNHRNRRLHVRARLLRAPRRVVEADEVADDQHPPQVVDERGVPTVQGIDDLGWRERRGWHAVGGNDVAPENA